MFPFRSKKQREIGEAFIGYHPDTCPTIIKKVTQYSEIDDDNESFKNEEEVMHSSWCLKTNKKGDHFQITISFLVTDTSWYRQPAMYKTRETVVRTKVLIKTCQSKTKVKFTDM